MNTLKLVIYIFGTQMNLNFCSLASQFLSIKVSKTRLKVFQCLLMTWTTWKWFIVGCNIIWKASFCCHKFQLQANIFPSSYPLWIMVFFGPLILLTIKLIAIETCIICTLTFTYVHPNDKSCHVHQLIKLFRTRSLRYY
jgi:hypothetical protein